MNSVEYPDPVIAAYVLAVCALPAERLVPPLLALFRDARSSVGLGWRLRFLFLHALNTAVAWLGIRVWNASVVDKGAADEYRRMQRELRRQRWDVHARVQAELGLYALRVRNRIPENADRMYKNSMERRIPRASIGW